MAEPESLSLELPLPKTVVEKVDPLTPSYGEVPGTLAYDVRQADAVPDVVMAVSSPSEERAKGKGDILEQPRVPITKVTTVDHNPVSGQVPGIGPSEKHPKDAVPDLIEEQGGEAGTTSPQRPLFP